MSVRDKWVRRFAVDETAKHKKGFTIYKITSVLFPLSSPEAVTVVSVYKRYSDIQRLHSTLRALHQGLHLGGTFPTLAKGSYFKRFDQEVIRERAKSIKVLLDFIAEHRLLFTSTEFVNFLQNGVEGVSLSEQPPIMPDTVPSTEHIEEPTDQTTNRPDISEIEIFEAADVEYRDAPRKTDSYESLDSLDSINSDLFDNVNRIDIDKRKTNVLPDLINFDAPSTSRFDENTNSDAVSMNSTIHEKSASCVSLFSASSVLSRSNLSCKTERDSYMLDSSGSVLSRSNVSCKTRTEDSYVFEAGYLFSLAARSESVGDYKRAFECYKNGIEILLQEVQNDADPQRRALIKQKTTKYLSHAETIYNRHLVGEQTDLSPLSQPDCPREIPSKWDISVLSSYRFLAVLGSTLMLVLHRDDQKCYVIKVIQKIPNNMSDLEEFVVHNMDETKKPILPTNIPYMVDLHGYVETENLIFLILSHAPGEKLLDYIKNYSKSTPNTPSRELNLNNVFPEPKNIDSFDETDHTTASYKTDIVTNNNIYNIQNSDVNTKTELDVSVNELVKKSQTLLLNVDKVLSDVPKKVIDDVTNRDKTSDVNMETVLYNVDRPPRLKNSPRSPSHTLSPNTVRGWAAEILVALDCLHQNGVICRDLNPNNILLGKNGRITLTYFIGYNGLDVTLSLLRKHEKPGQSYMYMAPELYANVLDENGWRLDKVCDYWSYGVVLYELLCGVPPQLGHNWYLMETIVPLPDFLDIDSKSLLTQLLCWEPTKRLGYNGTAEVMSHPFYMHVDWDLVRGNITQCSQMDGNCSLN